MDQVSVQFLQVLQAANSKNDSMQLFGLLLEIHNRICLKSWLGNIAVLCRREPCYGSKERTVTSSNKQHVAIPSQ